MSQFSEYVIYADESGDHSLTNIDSDYPVFVLCLCIFHKKVYTRRIVPRVQDFKFRWFGHDSVVLHERDIRKQLPPFTIYRNRLTKALFISELTEIVRLSPFRIAASVIDKSRLSSDFFEDNSPYDIALEACMVNVFNFLDDKIASHEEVHFIFEKRGNKEDRDLELAFRRICAGDNRIKLPFMNFRIVFADKKANSSGMQLADLTARPIGIKTMRPWQANAAYDVIKRKLVRATRGRKQAGSIILYP